MTGVMLFARVCDFLRKMTVFAVFCEKAPLLSNLRNLFYCFTIFHARVRNFYARRALFVQTDLGLTVCFYENGGRVEIEFCEFDRLIWARFSDSHRGTARRPPDPLPRKYPKPHLAPLGPGPIPWVSGGPAIFHCAGPDLV